MEGWRGGGAKEYMSAATTTLAMSNTHAIRSTVKQSPSPYPMTNPSPPHHPPLPAPAQLDMSDQNLLAGGTFEVDFKVNRDRGMSFEFFAFQSDEAGEIGAISSITAGPRIELPTQNTVTFSSQIPPSSGIPRTPNRPRGDSIIFDPRSFEDGGIHETAALGVEVETPLKERIERRVLMEDSDEGETEDEYMARLALDARRHSSSSSQMIADSKISVSNVIDGDQLSRREKMKLQSIINKAKSAIASKVKPKRRKSTSPKPTPKSIPKKVVPATPPKKKKILVEKLVPPAVLTELAPDLYISSHAGDKVLVNSAVVLLTAALNNNLFTGVYDTSPFAALHTLNKEGRIGIYTPAQRKARVKKFHSKRKMRIWRKRIKYDCRKKLADSRPRIKGRFVKRQDVVTGNEGAVEIGVELFPEKGHD